MDKYTIGKKSKLMNKKQKKRKTPAPIQPVSPRHYSKIPALKDPVQLYLQEISRFPVLSKQEERKISEEFYQTRDPQLARQLVTANLRFVVKIAAEYTRFGARLMDLIQEGNMGLLHAIKEFNPYKGACLITYAVWWIRGYMQEYLMRQYSLVRMGTNAKQRKLFYLLRKEQEQMAQLPYQEGTKLLLTPNFKEQEVENMRQRLKERDLSLDQPLSTESATRFMELQSSTAGPSVEENLNFFQEKKILQKSIAQLHPTLNKKEKFILKNRLLSDSPFTLNEIGQHFSVTREAVRQVESRLIKKIKNLMIKTGLQQSQRKKTG